jgi:hypothetical protein
MFRTHFMILFTVASLSLHLTSAQDSEEFDEPLSKKEAEQTLKLADEALANAERAQRRGDTSGMERALENYSRHINKLERTIHGGNVRQDDHEDVAVMFFHATDKHTDVLDGLLSGDKVPDEGKAGITKALAASMKGHTTAFANVHKERQEELAQRHEQHGPGSGASSSRSDDSLRGSRPSTGPGTAHGPGTVGGPSRGGSQGGQGRGRR